jgi:DNA-binding transcriptional MerR regulator
VPDPLIEIPERAAFKASEVCEIAQIPPYVLRSWEKEFPGLGVSTKPGGQKVYRRSDIEQVLRIKQLLFAEGLTLAGARRKLEGEPPSTEAPLELPVPEAVKQKVSRVKQELRSLLDLLGPQPEAAKTPVRAAVDSEDAGGVSPPVGEAPSSPVAGPTPSTWPPVSRPGAEGPPGLPLLDPEAETSSVPPAATVPGQRRRKGTGR